MKIKALLMFLNVLSVQLVSACPLCGKRQPKITMGVTHGVGPQSDWDWVIIVLIAAITIWTLVFSVKKLIKPGEKNADHIKYSILSN